LQRIVNKSIRLTNALSVHPAFFIDAAVLPKLRILDGAGRLRLSVTEAVEHSDAFDWLLCRAIDDPGSKVLHNS
jgi:hypothetical protein